MARDGSGTYTTPSAAFIFDTIVDEVAVNLNFSEIATAMTATLAKTGVTEPTANLQMNNRKHTGVAAGAAVTDYMDVSSYQDGKFIWGGTATGTDTITFGTTPALTSYVKGQSFLFLAAGDNLTTSVTINIDSLGAKALKKAGGTALAVGDIVAAGAPVRVVYDGTDFEMQLNSSTARADGYTFKIGSFTKATTDGTGTDPITDVGFQPTHVMFLSGGDGNIPNNNKQSYGLDDGTNAFSLYFDFSGGGVGLWSTSSTKSIYNVHENGDYTFTGNISSMDSDGFTVSWTKTGSLDDEDFRVLYLAIKAT